MKQELTLTHIGECFGGNWFSLDEAWTNLFSTYSAKEFDSANKMDGMRRVLEKLYTDKYLEKTGALGTLSREYRLTQKAKDRIKSIPAPVPEEPELPGTLEERLDAYAKALEREMAQKGRDPILDDSRRLREWRYRCLKRGLRGARAIR